MAPQQSLFYGPTEPPLWDLTIGQLVDQQTTRHGNSLHLVVPWQDRRFSFNQFSERSTTLAKALLGSGLQHGDHIGIFAGNSYQYLELLVAAGRIGCPSVSFNTTYTAPELLRAADFTECKTIFISTQIGQRDMSQHIESLLTLPRLRSLVIINGQLRPTDHVQVYTYEGFYQSGSASPQIDTHALQEAQSRVKPSDIFNIQFTSGTTGSPKAAMLTHKSVANNGRFLAQKLQLTSTDIIACPPPMFHCFGSIGGFIATLSVGGCLLLPSEQFDPSAVIDAVTATRATVLHGVPAMFVAYIDVVRKRSIHLRSIRTGIIAGSAVPPSLAADIEDILGIRTITTALGMTELSPVSLMPSQTDDVHHRIISVGKVMPHSAAKIIDPSTLAIVPVGTRGELCVSGYNVCKGYLKNREKTAEAMKKDTAGVVWMHTGDECYFDEDGYCYFTGRIKDIIIRGGENIYPMEIEARLVEHEGVAEASVFGVRDERFGEAVGCVLRASQSKSPLETEMGRERGGTRPTEEEIKYWVAEMLGRQKVPQYVYWLGDQGVGGDYPKTGSGKVQKFELQKVVERLLEGRKNGNLKGRARL